MGSRGCLGKVRELWELRPLWIVPLAVLGILPLLIMVPSQEGRCAYVLLVMAALWLTETIPISATALLPVFMFPLVGVQPASAVSRNYITDTSLLFFGGLILAVAIEEWNLHRRIALGVLSLVGGNPMWLMLGMMLPTWFLSMWISNTATTSMMIPILSAVLQQLAEAAESPTSARTQGSSENLSNNTAETTSTVENSTTSQALTQHDAQKGTVVEMAVIEDIIKETDSNSHTLRPGDGSAQTEGEGDKEGVDNSPEHLRLCKGMSLCIAYAANIGGIATLTGTGPNLILKGQTDLLYGKYGLSSGVTFASWMILAFPLSAATLVMAWLWLLVLYVRGGCCHVSPEKSRRIKASFRNELRKMGPITMAEVELLVLFSMLVLLWLSRDPRFAPGWDSLFKASYVSDASAALLFSVLLFILPARRPRVLCFRRAGDTGQEPGYTPLLAWDMVHRRLPWGVMVLLGGGFALADACKVSGLSSWVGRELSAFSSLSPWLLNLITSSIVTGITEVTSNVATSSLMLPIFGELALQAGVSPLYLMASGAIAASFAFMLPVATPPNAIVFAHGYLRIPDMAVAGLLMNVLAVGCLTLAVNTWGDAYFDFLSLSPAFLNATTPT